MDEFNSAALLRQAASDPAKFDAFYRRHFDAVLAFIVRRVCDAELAVDLAAETFAQALLSSGRFRGSVTAQAEAWIFKIAGRQVARYQRRGMLERNALEKLGIEVPTLSPAAFEEIERLADLQGLRSILRQELAKLTDSQRDAVQLRVVDELPYPIVAERLGISEQAARLRVSRALRLLAASMSNRQLIKESSR